MTSAPRDGSPGHAIAAAKDILEAVFGPRTIKLLVLAIFALIIPLLFPGGMVDSGRDVGFGPVDVAIRGTLLVTGAILIMCAIGSGLLELRARQQVARSTGRPEARSAQVLGGQLIIGLEVARQQIRYGALRLRAGSDADGQLGSIRLDEAVSTRRLEIRPGSSRAALYHLMVMAIRDLLASLETTSATERIAGIAVSTPSWIDIRTKSLASTVGPFPVHEPLVANLARRLWDEERNVVRQAFQPALADRNDLEARIFLDTDSRSVARYDLHERLKQDIAYRNYACVLVLEGVGAGLVLGGEIYYGSHSSEGEIGHMTVHLVPEYRIPGAPDAVAAAACDCQLPGVHWETIAGVNGLPALAASLEPARFTAIATAYGGRPTSHDLIDVACAVRDNDANAGLPPALADAVKGDLGGYQAYCATVLREYARIVTVGVANMANLLDLEHVVIGGPIMTDLDRVAFRDEVRRFWNEYVIRGQAVGHSYRSLEQVWQGAALLFWDPSYLRRML